MTRRFFNAARPLLNRFILVCKLVWTESGLTIGALKPVDRVGWAVEQLVVHEHLQKEQAIPVLEELRADPLVRLSSALIARAVRRIEEL